MPSASISTYIWNVVSGVRNSCVTAVTNNARRLLRRMMPASRQATVAAVASMQAQATAKREQHAAKAPSGLRREARRARSAAARRRAFAQDRRPPAAAPARMWRPARDRPPHRPAIRECPAKSKRQPWTYSCPAAETRRARSRFSPTQSGVIGTPRTSAARTTGRQGLLLSLVIVVANCSAARCCGTFEFSSGPAARGSDAFRRGSAIGHALLGKLVQRRGDCRQPTCAASAGG